MTPNFGASAWKPCLPTPNSQLLTSIQYGYDDASRLESVGDGAYSANYSYLANSSLVEEITFKQNTTTRMTTTKAYDGINRLTSISHADGAATLASYAYGYNAANQRTNITHADDSYWTFGYDDLGQVIEGKKRNDGDQLFPGLQYEYDYDDIGNRIRTRSGGDGNGSNLRTNDYSANLLNQYTNRAVGPYIEVHGEAATNATVTVNNQPADRLGTFYRKELNPDNSTATVLQGITNVAVLKNAGTNNQDIVTIQEGNKLLQQNPENFTYDSDGNLTSNGLWTNTWNGENRLIQMESLSGVPAAARRKLVFGYDSQGRRISKDSYVWNTGTASYDLSYSRKFLYDGWNLIAELDGNTNLVHGFAWGLDLSGSEQGAGGAGGLLLVETTNAVHLAGHDGNGNVTVLVGGSDSTITARYEYSPFGQLLRASGPMAFENKFRFSTKYQDDETGFSYYGLRFYNPDTGRWLNRDPIEELDGINVFAFTRNNPIDAFDVLGLYQPIKQMSHALILSYIDSYRGNGISTTMGFHTALARLFSQFPSISTIVHVPGQYAGEYFPWSQKIHLDELPALHNIGTLLHEMTHAYNHLNNTHVYSGYNHSLDEGVAYSLEKLLQIHSVVAYWDRHLNENPCEFAVDGRLEDQWRTLWRNWGDIGRYGEVTYRWYGILRTRDLNVSDITNLASILGIKLSCQSLADYVNSKIENCCPSAEVVCDETSDVPSVFPTTVPINPVFR